MKRASSARIWLVVGLLSLVAGGALVVTRASASAQAELDARLADLRRTGAPLSLKELARKPPVPDENAATYLRRAREAIDAIDKEVDAAYENQSEADQREIDLGRPTAGYLRAIRSAVEAYPQGVALVKQAAACNVYDAQLNTREDTATFSDELAKQTQLNRAAMRMLSYLMTLQTGEGDNDAAVRTGIVMLRLSRLYDSEPTLMGSLVAFACRSLTLSMIDLALRSGEVSTATRDRLDEELARSDLVDVFRNSLVTDRAYGLTVLEEIKAGTHRQGPERLAFAWQTPAAFKSDQSGYLDYMTLSIALAEHPFADVKDNPALGESLRSAGALAEVVAPVTQAAHAAMCRTLTYQRAVRILNAIQRYEHDNPGQEPTVADLHLPEATTTDPFNGQPLHVVKKPGGWLIYAVDMNLKDQGGKVTPPIDCGFGPLPREHYD